MMVFNRKMMVFNRKMVVFNRKTMLFERFIPPEPEPGAGLVAFGFRRQLGSPLEAADVTEAAVAGKLLTPAEKTALVNKLNEEAVQDRNKKARAQLERLAAETFRSRVVCFPDVDSAKTYMETGEAGMRLVARTILVDVTMPGDCQTAPKSRRICRPPTDANQKEWVRAVKMLPCTPGSGHVLIRHALRGIEVLSGELKESHSHVRQITVPVEVPKSIAQAVNDATRTSSLDFIMRTVGRTLDDEEDADMNLEDLEVHFGSKANDIEDALFRHASRIAAPAIYFPRSAALKVKRNEQAEPLQYRKGQVHASVFYSAFQCALSLTSAGLGPHEVLVILTGGTPEAATAAIAVGFKKVLFVSGDPTEVNMMKVPDNVDGVDFSRCP
jgi:hypothetical protein